MIAVIQICLALIAVALICAADYQIAVGISCLMLAFLLGGKEGGS